MATIKKVVAKKPLAKKPLVKAQKGGPKFKDPSPKPTRDSTNYYTGKEAFYRKAYNNLMDNKNLNKPDENGNAINKAQKLSMDAVYDLQRQKLKGKPGYDANGFPVEYKKGGATKPKAQLGAIVKGIKAIGKGASKLNEMRPMVKYKNYGPGGHGKKALLKQGAEMAIIGGAGTAAAGKALLSGAKKPVVKKKK